MSDSTDGSDDEELAADVDELTDVLRELRGELVPDRRGPFGTNAPSPSDLLRFADHHAIPFVIAVLEANIRALELLQGAIRLTQSGAAAGEEAKRAQDRVSSLGRSTLTRLDGVLTDLETAAKDGGLPEQAEAREVLTEARRLRDNVDDALATRTGDNGTDSHVGGDGESNASQVTEIEVEESTAEDEGDAEESDSATVDVDVEGELHSIKKELGKLDDEPADEVDDEPTDEPDESEDGSDESDESDGGPDEPDESEDGSDELDESENGSDESDESENGSDESDESEDGQ